ncbi:MAG: hypothetical protein HYY15_05200 [Candidatus Omnitrophica bacterium]|nr:hypothetical protein [Candidatus Omnitrophota bacterium]
MSSWRYRHVFAWGLVGVVSMALVQPLAAEIPPLIRYQGQAVDQQGIALEGPYTLTFRLYDAETDGQVVWQEIQPNIPVSRGHFAVFLGQVTSLVPVDWSQPRWLTVQIGTDPELLPRQRIVSVPLALRAAVAEGLAQPTTTSTITDDANKLVPSGAVIMWTGASCPAGYTRLTVLDGRFLVGGGSYNAAAGGSDTHTHGTGSYAGPSHTHAAGTLQTNDNAWPYGGGGGEPLMSGWTTQGPHAVSGSTASGGTGSVTGTSASADSRPAFATVLLCQKS